MSRIVSVEDVAHRVERKEVTLIDVLPPPHFTRGHLPGARNVPLDELDALVASALPDKGAAIVVYCSGPTCKSYDAAERRLIELGYVDVGVFTGGKSAWTGSGRSLEVVS